MKFSCTPISFHASFRDGSLNLRTFFSFCAQHGLEGVDLLDIDGYPWLWSSGAKLKDCAKWAQAEGLVIAAYACGNNFARPTEEERAAQVLLVGDAIEGATECEAPLLRIFGGYHRGSGGHASIGTVNGLDMVLAGLEKCLPLAEKHGVVLALENHGRLPGHSYESAAILEYFNSPWLKVLYDPANYLGNNMDEDEDPIRAYETLKGSIIHTHFKDVGPPVRDLKRRREPYVAGQGITPLRQIIARMIKDGYDGFGALEYEAALTVPEGEGVPASIAYLQEARAAALLQLRKPVALR